MWQHFFYPHLTLGKPIFHPGQFSFQIQTGTYFTSPEKTWFTKIRPRKFQTNIQSEYHRKNPRASSPFTFFPPCFKISQFFSITVRLSQVSFYWDCLAQANKRYHGNHWLRKNYNSHCLGYVRSLWYSGPHYTSSQTSAHFRFIWLCYLLDSFIPNRPLILCENWFVFLTFHHHTHRRASGLCSWTTAFCSFHIANHKCNKSWSVKPK